MTMPPSINDHAEAMVDLCERMRAGERLSHAAAGICDTAYDLNDDDDLDSAVELFDALVARPTF